MTMKTAARKATIGLAASVLATTFATALAVGPANADLQGNAFFATPGTYTWKVPAGVDTVDVDVYGAAGGGVTKMDGTARAGASGGHVRATMAVTPGQTYTILVGGQGGAAAESNDPAAGGSGGFAGGGHGGAAVLPQGLFQCTPGGGGGGRSALSLGSTPVIVAGGG